MTETIVTASVETFSRVQSGYNTETDYATARANAGSPGANAFVGQYFATPYYNLYRSFLRFNTSVIPAADLITDVKMRIVLQGNNSDTEFILQVCEQDWSSQYPLAAGNMDAAYDNCLSESDVFSLLDTTGKSTNTQYTGPSMNNSYINKSGYTYYSFRSSRDYGNNTPTGLEYVQMYRPDTATESYRPVLIITHETSFKPKIFIF